MIQAVPPSIVNGFARYAGESDRPEFWSGLLCAWAPFLEMEGRVFRDRSGYGYGNAAVWQAGCDWAVGGGLIHVNFPDTGISGVTGPDVASLQNGMTIVAHLRQADYTKTQHICSVWSPQLWQFYFDGGTDLEFRVKVGSNRDSSITLSTAYNNVWFSVACRHSVVDGGAVFAENAGKVTNGYSGAMTSTPTQFHLGHYGSAGEDLVGDIAALYVYNRPLSDAAIWSLMQDWQGPMRLKRRGIFKAAEGVPPTGNPAWYWDRMRKAM